MKRIVMHWTAGGHKANATDKRHYHFIVEGDGAIVAGNHPPEANARIASPNDGSTYAAHTGGLNTGSIGIAMAAMREAREVPFTPGPSPITEAQLDAFCALAARLCLKYGIPLTGKTVLTHAEVDPVLGVKQSGKWDITYLPGMAKPGNAIAVGNEIRARIHAHIERSESTPGPTAPATKPGAVAGLLALLLAAAGVVGAVLGWW